LATHARPAAIIFRDHFDAETDKGKSNAAVLGVELDLPVTIKQRQLLVLGRTKGEIG
jgi:hypothetical protein